MKNLNNLIKNAVNPKIISLTDLQKKFPEFVKRAKKGEYFIITKAGKPVAVLMNPLFYQILNSPSST